VGFVLGIVGLILAGLAFQQDARWMLGAGALVHLAGWIVGLWCTNVGPIAWRELNALFLSPIAYVVLTVFLVLTGFFFTVILEAGREASMAGTFGIISTVLMFVTPMISMRLLAEESRAGTIETLMTAPVTEFEVVFGKFVAGVTFLVVMLFPTLAYVLMLGVLSNWNLDWGPIVSGYLGLLFIGAMFISLGLLCSSLTRNQIAAAVSAFVAVLLIWLIGFVGERLSGVWASVTEYVGVFSHYDAFQKGLVDTTDPIYFLAMIGLLLFAATRTLESRKWR
jgi:ABC-2 type transport system permease protein